MLARLRSRIRPQRLGPRVYRAALERCSEKHLRSGAIFDALHLIASEQNGAEAFVTFNREDFERLSEGGTPEIVVPQEPPPART